MLSTLRTLHIFGKTNSGRLSSSMDQNETFGFRSVRTIPENFGCGRKSPDTFLKTSYAFRQWSSLWRPLKECIRCSPIMTTAG